MPIPESQLETWANQGALTTAKATHESIRNSLTASASPIRNKDFEIYLQGSYKNSTNIRGDSDVDVVVQLNSTFGRDLSKLTAEEERLYKAAYDSATYFWADFRRDVLSALRSYYGNHTITEGNKSIKIAGGSNRLPADVVACLHYRKYQRFRSTSDQDYIDGIKFYTIRENRQVINFPKVHYDNGVRKNGASRTNGWYKPAVRIFKNARTYLVNQGTITSSIAPSYFLECLIYNVPDGRFGNSYRNTFYKILEWLEGVNLDQLVCQNGQLLLFGTTPEQWSKSNAQIAISALIELWNNW